MDKKSRRSYLKDSILATSGIAMVGTATAKKPENAGLRLRRGLGDPISPTEIENKKTEILKEVPEARSGDGAPRRSKAELDDNEFIVGYNLDIVDGAPSEWVGVYKHHNSAL